MTQKIINVILALGLAIVAGGTIALFNAKTADTSIPNGYGATSNITRYDHGVVWFDNTHYFGTNQQASVDTSGNITAPTLILSKTSGTSTVAVGCVQANATSTATNIKLVFSPAGATSTFNGTAYWSYGTCP